MRKIFLIMALVIPAFLLTGCLTGTIKGQVIDTMDRPVVGAIVTTRPPSHSVRSTENGYKLDNIPVGEYTIMVEKPGYTEGKAQVNVQWNSTTDADIQIDKKE